MYIYIHICIYIYIYIYVSKNFERTSWWWLAMSWKPTGSAESLALPAGMLIAGSPTCLSFLSTRMKI